MGLHDQFVRISGEPLEHIDAGIERFHTAVEIGGQGLALQALALHRELETPFLERP
jgi:hypothetical protein